MSAPGKFWASAITVAPAARELFGQQVINADVDIASIIDMSTTRRHRRRSRACSSTPWLNDRCRVEGLVIENVCRLASRGVGGALTHRQHRVLATAKRVVIFEEPHLFDVVSYS